MAITLFHGSEKVIRQPSLQAARPHNDYGRGFYCTLDEEMAKEWACKRWRDGFANCYALRDSGLKVLDLLSGDYTVLHWIALLLSNRQFDLRGDAAPTVRDQVIARFGIDVSDYDVVVGYRADDSYFQYAQLFVENGLSVQNLGRALVLGELGEQTVLVSEKAFARLSFERAAPADASVYCQRFTRRDGRARRDYRRLVAEQGIRPDALYAIDVLRGGIDAEDPRIPRMVR